MHVHEYQAKEILRRYGIPSPPFEILDHVSLTGAALRRLETKDAVVKAQVHAGGRGKAGAVKLARGEAAVEQAVDDILGLRIVNNQTGPQGIVTEKVMLTPPVSIAREFYMAITVDRRLAAPVLMLSSEGGMDIEEVAERQPHLLMRQIVPPRGELYGFQLANLADHLRLSGAAADQAKHIFRGAVAAFLETDASLLELNPLVLTEQGELLALDAKMSFDDNALFRHPDIAGCFDPTQLAAQEVQARAHDLSYVALSGDIGCMVNGAGLAMATMDIIQLKGGRPANFLDVGGGASKEKVTEAFRIIAFDPKVKAILVNIFGGIMNCVTIAEGVIQAVRTLDLKVPLVVRLEGTEVEAARALLAASKLPIQTATALDEAASLAVKVAGR
jgi:succinyl-CoA synthetase beta subunit